MAAAAFVVVTACGAPAAGQPAPFAVALSFTPSSSDPLLVIFTATVTPGTPSMFNWSFGDGEYWNGTGPGFASPAHRYPDGGGTYLVSVVVHEGTAVNSTSLSVTVVPAALAVSVVASPASGPAALTVNFTATVTGGTGTYLSFAWAFGDGGHGSGLSVRYTYPTAGTYRVTVNVTDSGGASAGASTVVTVRAGASPTLGEQLLGDWPELMAGGALGAGGTIAAVLWVLRRRRRSRRSEGVGPAVPPGAARGLPARPPPAPPAAPPEGVPAPGTAVALPREAAGRESLRISQRVVLHLASQGRLGPDDVAPPSLSQAGIAGVLKIRQNALTNVLRRLVAAGVVVESVRHVRGQPRRLKVYQLTARGPALARELREHPASRASPR